MVHINKLVNLTDYFDFKDSTTLSDNIGILSQNEAENAVDETLFGMGDIVIFSPTLRCISDYHLRLISMINKLENIPEDFLNEKGSMVNVGYNSTTPSSNKMNQK